MFKYLAALWLWLVLADLGALLVISLWNCQMKLLELIDRVEESIQTLRTERDRFATMCAEQQAEMDASEDRLRELLGNKEVLGDIAKSAGTSKKKAS